MNVDKWINEIIMSRKCYALPIMTHPGIELSGATVLAAVKDGEIHSKAIEILIRRFPQSIASTVIMDLTVEAEAFGSTIQFYESEVPCIVGRLVSNYDEAVRLQVPSLEGARVPQYLKANKLASLSINKPVLGGCIGPYSLAGRLFDMTEILMAIYTNPDTVNILLEKCTSFIIKYCHAIKSCGSAGVIIAEPAAGLLSNEDCLTYSSTYVKRIVDAVQDETFMVVLHNCGNMGQCTSAMVATGAKGYHFGNKIDMLSTIKECPPTALVMGNIDPVSVFKQAEPKEVYQHTFKLLEQLQDYSNFVISTGCDVPPEVPLENITAFYDALNDFNKEKEIK